MSMQILFKTFLIILASSLARADYLDRPRLSSIQNLSESSLPPPVDFQKSLAPGDLDRESVVDQILEKGSVEEASSFNLSYQGIKDLNEQATKAWLGLLRCNRGSQKQAIENFVKGRFCELQSQDHKQALESLDSLNRNLWEFVITSPLFVDWEKSFPLLANNLDQVVTIEFENCKHTGLSFEDCAAKKSTDDLEFFFHGGLANYPNDLHIGALHPLIVQLLASYDVVILQKINSQSAVDRSFLELMNVLLAAKGDEKNTFFVSRKHIGLNFFSEYIRKHGIIPGGIWNPFWRQEASRSVANAEVDPIYLRKLISSAKGALNIELLLNHAIHQTPFQNYGLTPSLNLKVMHLLFPYTYRKGYSTFALLLNLKPAQEDLLQRNSLK